MAPGNFQSNHSKLKTVFLHIGNFKTGSSAIQKYCSDNRQLLLEQGIDYIGPARPRSNPTNHGKLPLSLYQKYGKGVPRWYDERDTFEQVAETIADCILKSECQKIVISSEEFYRISGFDEVTKRQIGKDLSTLFAGTHVKLLMYVRPPLGFARSWYNQLNKANVPVPRFIDFFYELSPSMMLPQSNAEYWRNIFGDSTLAVEPFVLRGAPHIERFLRIVDRTISISVDVDLPVNPPREESTLEGDRIARILLLKDKERRRRLLRNKVFTTRAGYETLRHKIDMVNTEFDSFCRREDLEFANSTFDLGDLLLHEERVNRKDVLAPRMLDSFRARFRESPLSRVIKRVRGRVQ